MGKNNEECGSAGFAYRLEGIRIKLIKKGNGAPGTTAGIFHEKNNATTNGSEYYNGTLVRYNTHVQTYGWQDFVTDGKMAGTSGQSKRLEGIHILLTNTPYSGGIEYRTHIQKLGWQDWKANGAMSGTSGKSLRLEAIQIRLTGEIASQYDVYYRVHAQTYGWLDWAKNGESAGTAGLSKRLEGICIKLVKKGNPAPGNTARAYVSNTATPVNKSTSTDTPAKRSATPTVQIENPFEEYTVPSSSPSKSSNNTTNQPNLDSLPIERRNAVKRAQNYLDFLPFSKQGLIEQLSSEYADKFSVSDASFAVNYLETNGLVNWYQEACEAAQNYLNVMAFSRKELKAQLSSESGSKFTNDQAEYAIQYLEKNNLVNWNEQAAKKAADYLKYMSFSKQGLIEQLSSEYGSGFTREQAEYGVASVGM